MLTESVLSNLSKITSDNKGLFLSEADTATAQNIPELTVPQNVSLPDGCLTAAFVQMDYLPWSNPDNIVSAGVEETSRRVKDFLLTFLFLIGGPGNVINMAVFYKQGLKERINLCLFALAVVDEAYLLICVLQNAERMYTQFASPGERNGPVLAFIVNHNLITFFAFAWVSQMYCAIIASERCLCVVSPLRSRAVLTTRTMAVILIAVVVVIVGSFYVVATKFRMVCVYDPVSNARFNALDGGEFYYRHQQIIDILEGVVYGFVLPGTAILVVTVTTVVTVVKLRQAVAWRSETSGALSTREVALTKMLVANSILFLACVTPAFLFRVIALFIPGMTSGGRFQNLFLCLLWIVEIFTYINSCFNIFVYYSMGSRYRETLKLMACCRRQQATGLEKSKTEAS